MEKTSSQRTPTTHPTRQLFTWCQAATLLERSMHLPRDTRPVQPNLETAQRKLQRWKEQSPFHTGKFFADRLAMDGLSEDDLLVLLAEPLEALAARISPVPTWFMQLAQAFEQEAVCVDVPVSEAGASHLVNAFLSPIRPLIHKGLDRLFLAVHGLSKQYAHLPFDPQTIASLLLPPLQRRLLSILNRTLVLELNVARVQGRLHGDTSQERFEDFVRQLCQPAGILPLLEEYTVLARQLVETVDLWIDASREFLHRLCADWEQICATFTDGGNPGVLAEVNGTAGDTHRGGRCVMTMKFSSGFQLVYKPKSLKVDKHFQELLAWLNERGHHPAFRLLQLIDKETYGWSEFVNAAECTSPEEVERFYEQQGAYLALFYVLEATDLHAENVIAAGEQPMLIDLEALFHPRVGTYEQSLSQDPAQLALSHSVWRVGLLPRRLWASETGEGVDMSGLGGQEGQRSPQPVPSWAAAGTDQMRRTHQHIELPTQENRPRLNGAAINTQHYRDTIVRGFAKMYRLLREHRDELATELLPRFAHDEVRYVPRDTRIYALLLYDSFHPSVLRDALDRDRLLDRLWVGIEQGSSVSRIIAAERDDLLRGDIPLFTTHPDNRDLFTSQGERIVDFFQEPSIELVKRRLQQLDEQDLEKQSWIIRASFTSLPPGAEQMRTPKRQLALSHALVSRERLLAGACQVGDRLDQLALCHEGMIGWLGVSPPNEREWTILPTSTDLYGGTTGIALFLAYLGALIGETRYVELAKAALRSVHYIRTRQRRYQDMMSIGAFEGLGASIYLLSHLGVLWHEPALFAEAEEIVEILPEFIHKDTLLDLMGGAAGCILSLLSLYHVTASPRALEVAVQCGNHLLETAQRMKIGVGWKTKHQPRPLTGLAHGNAGIALSLLRLSAALGGDERFKHLALEAIAFERSWFSAKWQSWLDLREIPLDVLSPEQLNQERAPQPLTAWCYGAAGIGLARLACLPYLDDAPTREEIDTALRTTLAEGFGRSHCLCHGDAGNLETLLQVAHTLGRPQDGERLVCMTNALLDSLDKDGWITGIPLGLETPGLMVGLAGIGYELLRLAEPVRLPSVLLVAPPSFHTTPKT